MPDIFTSDDNEMNMVGGSLDQDISPQIEQKILKSTHKKPSEEVLRKLPGHSHSSLSAYCYYPERVTFINKDQEEKVVLLVRKHPVTNIPWILTAAVMLLAPLVLEYFPLLDFLPQNFRLVAVLMWYLITTAFIFEEFLTWFFNVNIVTDERIFDVDFHNLLYRSITDANLDQIQDVTVRIGSVVRTLFNYGDVLIQTAGEVPEIEFEAVPHPDLIAKILRELRVEEEQEKIEGRVR